MSSLQSSLDEISQAFADSILDVIRGASLQDLLPPGDRVGNGREVAAPAQTPARTVRARTAARLARRSAEDIAKLLEQVVTLVKNPEGLRPEQVRQTLSLQAKEMPRALKERLATKKFRTKGQKRATTYFAK